jgi:hypothetical protein
MHMDLVKRNAEIVALVKARKMPMRKVAARYRLSTSSISLIAIRHGVHAQAPDNDRGMAGIANAVRFAFSFLPLPSG